MLNLFPHLVVSAVVLTQLTALVADTRLPTSLPPDRAAALNRCEEDTFNELKSSSISLYRDKSVQRSVNDLSSDVYTIHYTFGESLTHYRYIPGTNTATKEDSSNCTSFDITSTIVNDGELDCTWTTVAFGGPCTPKGYCSAKIEYIPQPGDITQIKEYCFATVLHLNASKPSSYPVTCTDSDTLAVEAIR